MERPKFDFYHWQQEYSCGIIKLDEHREKLIGIYNMMIERYNERRCKDNITDAFFKIAFGTESYFFDLEIMLRQLNYPGFSAKKEAHQKVLNRIVQFKEDFSLQKQTVCIDMLKFMSEWIQNEILTFDSQINTFLQTKGVSV